jgi:hypothetical protein
MFRNLNDKYIAVIFRKPFLSPPLAKGDLGGFEVFTVKPAATENSLWSATQY